MIKITQHGKMRMRERTSFNSKERKTLYNEALHKGLTPNDIQDIKFKNYLLSKPNCKIKVYRGYIFIHSKNSGRLYTMYEIPEKFRGGNNYGKSSCNS